MVVGVIFLPLLYFRVEYRHYLKLEKICLVLTVDKCLFVGIVDLSRANISVKLGIGKAEIILVGLAAESVDRSFVNELTGKPEKVAYFFYLSNRQL